MILYHETFNFFLFQNSFLLPLVFLFIVLDQFDQINLQEDLLMSISTAFQVDILRAPIFQEALLQAEAAKNHPDKLKLIKVNLGPAT